MLVRSDAAIAELHRIIQVAMGWEDAHLHGFRIHGPNESSSSSPAQDHPRTHAVARRLDTYLYAAPAALPTATVRGKGAG